MAKTDGWSKQGGGMGGSSRCSRKRAMEVCGFVAYLRMVQTHGGLRLSWGRNISSRSVPQWLELGEGFSAAQGRFDKRGDEAYLRRLLCCGGWLCRGGMLSTVRGAYLVRWLSTALRIRISPTLDRMQDS